jgi:hypothetical protein
MSEKYVSALLAPSKRVEIVRSDDKSGRWKPGSFGYAISYSTHPGMWTESGPSEAGALSYSVSKAKDGKSGATWFSAGALRFLTKTPRGVMADLPEEERVAIDLLLHGTNDKQILASLVPDVDRRAFVRTIADQMRTLRSR